MNKEDEKEPNKRSPRNNPVQTNSYSAIFAMSAESLPLREGESGIKKPMCKATGEPFAPVPQGQTPEHLVLSLCSFVL